MGVFYVVINNIIVRIPHLRELSVFFNKFCATVHLHRSSAGLFDVVVNNVNVTQKWRNSNVEMTALAVSFKSKFLCLIFFLHVLKICKTSARLASGQIRFSSTIMIIITIIIIIIILITQIYDSAQDTTSFID